MMYAFVPKPPTKRTVPLNGLSAFDTIEAFQAVALGIAAMFIYAALKKGGR